MLPGSDFTALANNLNDFRGDFEQIARSRAESDAARAEQQRAESGAEQTAPDSAAT